MKNKSSLLACAFFLLTTLGLAWNRADIEILLGSIILGWFFLMKFVGVFERNFEVINDV